MQAAPPGGSRWPGEGRVSFEWMEGRTFPTVLFGHLYR